jgi:hypothetical protein
MLCTKIASIGIITDEDEMIWILYYFGMHDIFLVCLYAINVVGIIGPKKFSNQVSQIKGPKHGNKVK